MPTVTEFTIHMEDRPGTLGKLCRAIADRGVNIVAFQSCPMEKGKSAVRIVTDNPTATKTVLNEEQATHSEIQVAKSSLPHRPGSLASAAEKLGEADININYAYAGIESETDTPVVIFGVAEVGQAAKLLDEAAERAA
jgi:hypothetical protein